MSQQYHHLGGLRSDDLPGGHRDLRKMPLIRRRDAHCETCERNQENDLARVVCNLLLEERLDVPHHQREVNWTKQEEYEEPLTVHSPAHRRTVRFAAGLVAVPRSRPRERDDMYWKPRRTQQRTGWLSRRDVSTSETVSDVTERVRVKLEEWDLQSPVHRRVSSMVVIPPWSTLDYERAM